MSDAVEALRATLSDQVLEGSRWDRVEITYPELETWIGARVDAYERVFVGLHSITIPAEKKKYIVYDRFPVTPGEIAREYLRTVWQERRTMLPTKSAPGWHWEAPIHCEPVHNTMLAYIDIEQAYWQLLTPWRPDDVPLPHGGCIEGELEWLVPSVVAEDRELRHAIVGTIFASRITWLRYGQPQTAYAPKFWSSPSLKRTCMQTLHAMATQVRRRYGLYAWLTDAAILDAHVAQEVSDFLAIHWGVRSRVVASGIGSVFSPTAYIVGEKRTRNFTSGALDPETVRDTPLRGLRRTPGNVLRRERLRRIYDR